MKDLLKKCLTKNIGDGKKCARTTKNASANKNVTRPKTVMARRFNFNACASNVKKKVFDPDGDYVSGAGFKRYLHSLKDFSSPIWNEVKDSIQDYDPRVIGISAKTQNFVSASIVAKIAKEINPDIKVVVGGVHPTMNGSKVLNCKDIDFLSIGENRVSFPVSIVWRPSSAYFVSFYTVLFVMCCVNVAVCNL